MVLIVGLGNPGAKYENTRHNLGFWVVDRLAARLAAPAWKKQGESQIAKGVIGVGIQNKSAPDGAASSRLNYLLAKPLTFMNSSGRAVNELLAYYKIPLEDFLVIVDDLELAPGTVRQRMAGTDGGHLGLRSIIQCVGSREFKRIRIGIGRPPNAGNVVSHVLGMNKAEAAELEGGVELAVEMALNFMQTGAFENHSASG